MWADNYIKELCNNKTVQFRPRGNSMVGRINSGDLVTVIPILDTVRIEPDDIVLCTVKGNQYLHLIKAIQGDRYQIGNNHGHINGWTTKKKIYGKVVDVQP